MRPTTFVACGFLAVLVPGTTACAGANLVAARAAEDLGCPEKDIKVTSRDDMGGYDAKGCGKHLSYVVRAGEVLPDSGNDPLPELKGGGRD
jgi:hypothetical protein